MPKDDTRPCPNPLKKSAALARHSSTASRRDAHNCGSQNHWWTGSMPSAATLSRWQDQSNDSWHTETNRLKALEQENARLRRIVTDQALEIAVLKDRDQGE